MAITKQEVRVWVNDKIKERREEVTKLIRETQDSTLDPIIEGMIADPLLDTLARHSQQFIDSITDAVHVFPYLESKVYYVNEATRNARDYGVELRKKLENNVKNRAVRFINSPSDYAYTLGDAQGSVHLHQTVHDLAALLRPEREKLAALDTLGRELGYVIDNEPSGKRAYKAMVAAGVDMKDFEERQKQKGNLPMAVKLSVDICVLNNNCG